MILTKTLPTAWKAFSNNKRYLLLLIPLEFIFLFVLTQITFSFFLPSAEAATRAGDYLTQQAEQLGEQELWQLESTLSENQEFMAAYHDLLTLLGYFFLSVLAAWIIFKAPVWYISHKTILKKMPLATSLLKFALLSLFWFVIVCIAFGIYSVSTGSTATLLPIVASPAATIIMWIIFAAIAYFAQVSFALIPAQQTFKNTFVYGVKYAKTIIPAFLVNALIAFIVLSLPFNWIQAYPLSALAIIVFITIPALAFTRLHIIVAVWQKH